jgi:hypothetical protein
VLVPLVVLLLSGSMPGAGDVGFSMIALGSWIDTGFFHDWAAVISWSRS